MCKITVLSRSRGDPDRSRTKQIELEPYLQIYFPKVFIEEEEEFSSLLRKKNINSTEQQSKSEGSSENFISSHIIGKSTVMR